jgi:hypothetical protein
MFDLLPRGRSGVMYMLARAAFRTYQRENHTVSKVQRRSQTGFFLGETNRFFFMTKKKDGRSNRLFLSEAGIAAKKQ